MSEAAAFNEVRSSTLQLDPAEQIDDLATRLVLNGPSGLCAQDFTNLAEQNDYPAIAAAAHRIMRSFEGEQALEAVTFTQYLSNGLDKLRNLLSPPSPPAAPPPAPVMPVGAATTRTPPPELSLGEDEDLILEFITESNEHLANIEAHMLALEKDNQDAEILNAVFRAFHTIKGLAGFLEFASIQSLAHEVETLLDLARNGELEVTPAVVDVILESTDVVRREFAGIRQRLAGNIPNPGMVDEALLQRIRNVSQAGLSMQNQLFTTGAKPIVITAVKPLFANDFTFVDIPAKPAALSKVMPDVGPVGTLTINPVVRSTVPCSSLAKLTDSASVRIDTGKLDQLMDLVGELVIAQTLIGHSPALTTLTDARLLCDLTQLARITAEVQRITTGMRMVPIGLQFQKTARVVRDLSRRAGKRILLETKGEDTEVDKTIAEELSDPLLHMVRNSIDHGIETSEERIAAGKDPVAHIRLAAYHQSGQIVISISDDGRGLNRERIFNKAVERGLIQAAAQLSDNDIFLLIFEAGFSTADKVTDISGRGVGMDVVRRHVQALRGRIDVHSKQGEGTTFFLKLPLTLAIIEGLVVIVGDQRFIIPIFSVKEMFRPTADMLSTVQGVKEMVMVRGGLLPVIRLHQRFHKKPRTTLLTEGTLIVSETEGHQFCLFVDDLIGKQEVVIKSLGSTFQHVVGIAGCAILGDGRVGLILEMHGIFRGKLQ